MQQTKLMKIAEVRATAADVVREQPVPHDVVQTARDTFQIMCQAAAEYGLTPADVIRAVLRPVLEKRRGCNCPTCKARRNELVEEQSERVSIPVI